MRNNANMITKDAIPVKLPDYIETFVLDGKDLEKKQLEILKGFYARLLDQAVAFRNIIFHGTIEDGYVFQQIEKEINPDLDLMPNVKAWVKEYISSLTKESKSQEEQLYIEVLEEMIKVLPCMSAKEHITVNFMMDKICHYNRRLFKVPGEEKYALIGKKKAEKLQSEESESL